jgi:hypothetical protein
MSLQSPHFLALAIYFLVTLACGRVAAQDLGDTVSEPGVFSYQAPKGWTIQSTQMSKYKVCLDKAKDGFAANINVVTEAYSGTLEKYVELNKAAIKGSAFFTSVEFVDDKPFVTSSGANGIRVTANTVLGKLNLRQSFYFFDGASSKFVVTTSSLIGDGDKYAPIFDASLKTFAAK